jgi:hypothetical protein
MNDSKRRQTLVNFRLTAEEYESVRAAALIHGSSSISGYIRHAVLTNVNSRLKHQLENSGAADVPSLDDSVLQLQVTIQHLNGVLELVGSAFVREAKRLTSTGPDKSNGSATELMAKAADETM